MLTTVLILGVVVVVLLVVLLVLRSRSGRNKPSRPPVDPHTHARDNTDPARSIDQMRSQGNSGGVGGAF
jgi:hypothetical protein